MTPGAPDGGGRETPPDEAARRQDGIAGHGGERAPGGAAGRECDRSPGGTTGRGHDLSSTASAAGYGPDPAARVGARVRIRGQVQGVGFRPFVWRLARAHGLSGSVVNDGEGVLVHLGGTAEALAAFRDGLAAPPPLARIHSVEWTDAPAPAGDFAIAASEAGAARTAVTPDAATCPACRAEIADPAERRHRYPFANCTDCGPRYSIVTAVPYDRTATTMAAFPMCGACRAEYENPADRRFHAQPIACPACGPRAWLEVAGPSGAWSSAPGDAVAEAARRLLAGEIVALKGLGGFHLACDATSADTVARLRARKHRPAKPFALMGRDLAMIARHSRIGEAEAAALGSPAAPIVVLDGADALAPGIAPALDRIGWMLPMTPLHVMLAEAVGRPLVMTSGNRSGEPQATTNEEARADLAGIADALLLHDRDIARRLDDPVVHHAAGAMRVLRRGRGLAPATLPLPDALAGPPVLALGGELKSAICLAADGRAMLSHHLGDLEEVRAFEAFEAAIPDLLALFDRTPAAIACDLHPAYRSTEAAAALGARLGVPVVAVQHHHAHVAAVMAEAGWTGGPVLGIAMDGTGHGTDGTIWGGEFVLATATDFTRVGHLAPVPLPGGGAAVRQPWRSLLTHLAHAFGADWPEAVAAAGLADAFARAPAAMVARAMDAGINAPFTSSAGRMFDALGAALGAAFDAATHEGQAAMEAEALAARAPAAAPYPFALGATLDPAPAFRAVVADLAAGRPRAEIAAAFHAGFAEATAAMARTLADRHGAAAFALSGGVMQNRVLLEVIAARLAADPRPTLIGREVPMNDGGLAFGQAAVVSARLVAGR